MSYTFSNLSVATWELCPITSKQPFNAVVPTTEPKAHLFIWAFHMHILVCCPKETQDPLEFLSSLFT